MRNSKYKEYNIYTDALEYLLDNKDKVDDGYLEYQFKIFETLIHHLTKDEGLVFNTLFAKISYLGLKYKPRKKFLFDLHVYRKEIESNYKNIGIDKTFNLGLYLILELLNLINKSIVLSEISDKISRPEYEIKKNKLKGKKLFGRFALLGKKESGEYVLVDEENPTEEILMRKDNLDLFKNSVSYIDEKVNNNDLPLTIGLVYIDIDSNNVLLPQVLVLQPDFLVDVTAIAECFKPYGGDARYFLINKFLKKPKNIYITIGNIVNFFLDELMNNPQLEFADIINSIFHRDPIMFALMDDKGVKKIVQNLKNHFINLKRVVNEDFAAIYIDRTKCYIEPSFYSPIFGVQGRLDIFFRKENSNEAAIIELKSGKLFRPNSYGLNTNHYTQTLLYELMLRSVFDFKVKPINYILYSVLEENNIRFAPTITAQQKEAISVRNDIIIVGESIIKAKSDFSFYENVDISKFPSADGFLKKDIESMQLIFKKMDITEKSYFSHFASFIEREHQLAKIGYDKGEKSRGQSALWLQTDKDKDEHFAILRNMELSVNRSGDEDSIIILKVSQYTNKLANFRKGDIILMYPSSTRKINRIESQIFKGTIVNLSMENLEIRLRSKISNQKLFDKNRYWNIEHDFLDSGFSKMIRSLFGFFDVDKIKRNLILSVEAPSKPKTDIYPTIENDLTDNQNEMVGKIVNIEDYFLLWGPPGTGKTSKVIKEVVKQLVEKGENIMLLAYTNRAVDELCEATENISEEFENNYIRIGSRFSTDSRYTSKLFDSKLKEIYTREDLKSLISNTSIFISTVSSLQSKEEIFMVKEFDTLIVDEASQLLEPMLVSILPHFKRFVLVGDHMQLPAVVTQAEVFSIVNDEKLRQIGLEDLRNSLFERLFNRAVSEKWDWAYGMLTEQGRMHVDIMNIANEQFYNGKLEAIQKIPRLTAKRKLLANTKMQKLLVNSRMIFIPSKIEKSRALSKVNIYEAKKIAIILSDILNVFKLNSIKLTTQTIGIITTFRAQIARIKMELENEGIDTTLISIDTVERYQGSARDIIIYSTSVNSITRLNQIVSSDINNLDRKLNVVLTRAKEQFILLGNNKILSTNQVYKKLIEKCKKLN